MGKTIYFFHISWTNFWKFNFNYCCSSTFTTAVTVKWNNNKNCQSSTVQYSDDIIWYDDKNSHVSLYNIDTRLIFGIGFWKNLFHYVYYYYLLWPTTLMVQNLFTIWNICFQDKNHIFLTWVSNYLNTEFHLKWFIDLSAKR